VDNIYLNQINKAINKEVEDFFKDIPKGTTLEEKRWQEFFSRLSKIISMAWRCRG